MKKLFLSALLFLSASASLLAETTKQTFNPLTGKFDLITVLSSSTLPSGSTFYIQNTSNLQTGAGFNISSGTISGSDGTHYLDFVSDSFIGSGRNQIRFYQDVFGSKTLKGAIGQQFSNDNAFVFSDGSNNSIAEIFASNSRASRFNYGIDLDNTGYLGFKPRNFNSDMTIQYGGGYFYRSTTLSAPVTVTLPQAGQISDPVESASFLICKKDATSHAVTFAASSGDTLVDSVTLSSDGDCVLYVSSVTNGTDTGFWYSSLRGSAGTSSGGSSVYPATSTVVFPYNVNLGTSGAVQYNFKNISADTTLNIGDGYMFRVDASAETNGINIVLPNLGLVTPPIVGNLSLQFCKVDSSTQVVIFSGAPGFPGDTAPDLLPSLLSAQDQCILLISSVTPGTDLGYWYPAFKTAKGYGSQYAIQIADGLGGVTNSNWSIYPVILGLTNTAFGENFFATINAGVGLGGVFRIYDPDLSNSISFGAPDTGFSENYRFDFPATRLGKNQVWTSTGPAGLRVQLVNQEVIISTGTLQSGATLYLSSGTILNLNSSTITLNTIQFGNGVVLNGNNALSTANALKFSSTNTVIIGATTLEKSLNGTGVGSSTFTANAFSNGFTFRVKAAGSYEQGSANVIFRLKVGTITVGDSGTQTLGTGNKSWSFDSIITIRSTGFGGSLAAQSYFFPQTSGSDIMFGLTNNTTHHVNTLIDNPITLTAQFDVADTTITATNFLIDSLVVSTATYNNINPTREILIPMAGMWPVEATSDSFAPIAVSTGSTLDSITANFDSATDQCRGYSFMVPPEVNSSSDTIFSIDWMSLSATSGAVGWYIKHNSGAYPGEMFQSTNTIQSHATSFDTVASSTYTLMRSSFQLALSSVAWVAGDNVLVSVCRDADNASDTMAGVARGILARFLFWRN